MQLVIWDLDDDLAGNVEHCAQHRVTKEEVEEVLQGASDLGLSKTSHWPVAFGETSTGRYLAVVYERVDENSIYPITAYDVPRKRFP